MSLIKFNSGLFFTAVLISMTFGRIYAAQGGNSNKFVFPPVSIVQKGTPSNDYLFLGLSQAMTAYLVIVDNNLTPVFGKRVDGTIYDFSFQNNGTMSYNLYPNDFRALDSSGSQIKQYLFPETTFPDIHDIKVMADGSYYVIGKEVFITDMSKYVARGDPAAEVITNSVHYMSDDGKELWSWEAVNSFEITDCDDNVDLLLHTIDWTHINSISPAPDGNLLISIRNFSAIVKINRITGRVMWQLGGKKNSFRFTNDVRGFSRQHDIQALPNGHILLFDNGNFLTPQYSSVLEYKLDEVNKTASLVKRYAHDESVWTYSMGGAQRLSNGGTLICWGESQNPCVTEVDSTGAVQLELKFDSPTFEYRARKFPWHTNYFTLTRRFIRFDSLETGDAVSKKILLYNPNHFPIEINHVEFQTNSFSLVDTLPVIIQPRRYIPLSLRFEPLESGHYSDKMTIGFSSDTFLIAQQLTLSGEAYEKPTGFSIDKKNKAMNFILYQNYPNPFNPSTTINYSIPEESNVRLTVFNSLGQEAAVLVNKKLSPGSYEVLFNVEDHGSGVYFYKLQAGSLVQIKKMVFLK